jgi:hypothetical protein
MDELSVVKMALNRSQRRLRGTFRPRKDAAELRSLALQGKILGERGQQSSSVQYHNYCISKILVYSIILTAI